MGRRHLVTGAAVTALLLACLSGTASGFSQGSPDTTCRTMEPLHGVSRQITPAPFTITPSVVEIEGGKQMEVTLEAGQGTSFKGFLVEGRSAETQDVVGTFFTEDHKYLNCDNGVNNAVTHRGPAAKSKVAIKWEPPSDFSGDVVFTGSFVQERTVFWVGVTSEKVTVKRSAPAPPVPETTTTTSTTTSTASTPAEVASLERDLINIYDDCGNSKGCFGFPAECETNKKCTMLVTYSKVSSGYKFEIVGSTTTGYVAAGLSDDEKMGGDSVMACLASAGANSGPDVVMAFNNGRNNEMLVEKKYGLSDIQAAVVNGQAYCTFVRDASTEISGIVFDLDKDRFHLMVATGPVNPNGLSYHDKRTVSSGTVALDSFETVEVRSDLFRTLHACFMVGAWICAASCGIIVARYFKKTWLKSRSCGIDQWFHLHRFFMGLTWSLVIAGVVLILYYLNGWKDLDSRNTEHAILGVVSTGLCFIQPFMALCRCSPTHKRRPVFNWLHWFVGNSAQILGIAAIYFGFGLIGAPTWVVFILIIFVAFHCLVHLLLSIGQCISDSRAESSSNVYPMKELNGSRTPLQPSEKNTDAPGAGFRKVMLFFYFLGNFLITAALLLVITVDEKTLKEWGLIFWE
ncbi:putative ferric-chelate reductase 1 homolog isoform X2 [Portunus trituberculatus]|uniref:putative ferric-chelate reductase 1 homolog isoform X2 n=1 Tax=Portunus trituberculatus TaxID=210409 RepID=UPI001E1CFED9|nr:putative ferric-chelate reductase 1 homolog isoform X2 [Portunus trituberculatus]